VLAKKKEVSKINKSSKWCVYVSIDVFKKRAKISSHIGWDTTLSFQRREKISGCLRSAFSKKYYKEKYGQKTKEKYNRIERDVQFSPYFENGESVPDDWDAFGDNRKVFVELEGCIFQIQQIRNIGYGCSCGALMGVAHRPAQTFSGSDIINSPNDGACCNCGDYHEVHQRPSWIFLEAEEQLIEMIEKILN
jgi:hypothetical protein